MLPRVLRNFNVIIEGRPMAGVAEELVLPSLERKMEEYRGAGMLGPVSLDLGLEPLKLEFTLVEFNPDVIKAWGLGDAGGINVRFMGAARTDDSNSAVDAIEVAVRGRWKKLEQGSAKNADVAKMKVEMPLTYYRYKLNGDVLIEIDLVSGKEVVGGVDRSADVMKALGLTS
jgi:P2 family phage contractile tail tube protein